MRKPKVGEVYKLYENGKDFIDRVTVLKAYGKKVRVKWHGEVDHDSFEETRDVDMFDNSEPEIAKYEPDEITIFNQLIDEYYENNH